MSLPFSLIICTYMRPNAVLKVLESVNNQKVYPNQILIIDGSTNTLTTDVLAKKTYKNLEYHLVNDSQRGLTKQRNFGIENVNSSSEVICFLDDDTILESDYFEQLMNTYNSFPDAIAVGGYITNEVEWSKKKNVIQYNEFELDGFVRKLGKRYVIRKKVGLLPDKFPGIMPEFSNGFPISFLPPSNKIFEVESFMGCAMSFKKSLFDKISFSNYFEGYGLYEDLDFCLRASKIGKLYVNTAAKLAHYHEAGGRPNKYNYGKMVVRNGWYVWRVKFSNPSLKARFKWNAIVFLQIALRGLNIINSNQRKEAFTETIGRKMGWLSLLLNKPKTERKI